MDQATPPPPVSPARLWQHRGIPHPLRRASRFLRILGPGLITGAADDDPSGIGTYSQAGAAFGTGQLWLALYLLPFVITVQEMCGRIGLVTGDGLAGVMRKHYSRKILFGAVTLLFIANTINVGADLGAMVASIRLLAPDIPYLPLLILLTIGITLIEIYVPYRYYAQVLKFLALSLLAYVITGIIVAPDWGQLLLSTIVPTIHFTPDFLALVVGVIGTTISPYLFFWQASEEVEEADQHGRSEQNQSTAPRAQQALRLQIRALRIDTVFGLFAASTTFWFIVMTTGVTLHAHGITNIASADEAAKALEPLVRNNGALAKLIFTLGIVGTGLLAVPVLAGSAAYGVAEAFGWNEGLAKTLGQAKGFYGVIAASTIVGLLLNLLGINPIAALVYAAVINGIVAVPLLVLILLIANNKGVMGAFTNGRLSNIVGIVVTATMGIAAIVTIITLFVH